MPARRKHLKLTPDIPWSKTCFDEWRRVVAQPCSLIFSLEYLVPFNINQMSLLPSQEDEDDKTVSDLAVVLFETATLRSGYLLPDTKAYGDRIERMLRLSLNIDPDAKVWNHLLKCLTPQCHTMLKLIRHSLLYLFFFFNLSPFASLN